MLSGALEKATLLAAHAPPPRVPLGVTADAIYLPIKQHEWLRARPARLRALADEIAHDAKRRFVLGREAYAADVRARAEEALGALERAELRHEDGSYAADILAEQEAARWPASEAAPDLTFPAAPALERADELAWLMQRGGYTPAVGGPFLRALHSRDTSHLRRLFTVFDEHETGSLDRARLVLTLSLLEGGVPPAQWSRLSRRLAAVSNGYDGDDDRGVEFNEFASLIRVIDLSGGVGKVAEAMGRIEAERAARRAEEALLRHVVPRMRKRCRAMFAEMMRAGYQPEEVSALLVAMFVSQEPEAIRRAWEVRITELLARTPLRPPTCACPRAPGARPAGQGGAQPARVRLGVCAAR